MSEIEQQPVTLLALAGSLRAASYNRRLVRLAAELAPAGVRLVEYTDLNTVEPFDEDVEGNGATPGADAFRAAVAAADGVFIVTPEYNGSVPGALKNALDWASRAPDAPRNDLQRSPMYGTPVAVASVSTGQFGAVWARDELLKSLRTQGARAVVEPSVTVPNAATAFNEDGTLTSAELQAKLVALVTALGVTSRTVRDALARIAAGG
ncbi:MAG: NAD(P)H-dependent oxidoreductase [Thermoleophilia bacterium]|nr:NAD(P)H-dependent oxidoreductase [Thermoleophilia bacterium]